MAALLAVAMSACGQGTATTAAALAAQVTPVTLPDVLTSEGRLTPVTSTWLAFQASGRVAEVLVQEGQTVKKGQALVQLEGSDKAEADLTAAKSALFLAQQNLNDAKKSEMARANASLALATAQSNYNDALGHYWNRTVTQGDDNQITLYQAKVNLAQNKVKDLQDQLDTMSEKLDTDDDKAKVIAELAQAKIDLQNTIDIKNYYKALPDNLDDQTLTAKLNVAKAALQDAQRDYDRTKNGPTPESLAAVQAAADEAQAQETDAQWAYDQLVLEAPYNGTFVECNLTQGQFVTAGQNAAEIADFSKWLVETDDLNEIKTAQIDTSKPVTITADALPGETFTGKVESVSQYYTNQNNDILYTVKIDLDPTTSDKLRWGMTMQVSFQK